MYSQNAVIEEYWNWQRANSAHFFMHVFIMCINIKNQHC